jgi:hypothetical protein
MIFIVSCSQNYVKLFHVLEHKRILLAIHNIRELSAPVFKSRLRFRPTEATYVDPRVTCSSLIDRAIPPVEGIPESILSATCPEDSAIRLIGNISVQEKPSVHDVLIPGEIRWPSLIAPDACAAGTVEKMSRLIPAPKVKS